MDNSISFTLSRCCACVQSVILRSKRLLSFELIEPFGVYRYDMWCEMVKNRTVVGKDLINNSSVVLYAFHIKKTYLWVPMGDEVWYSYLPMCEIQAGNTKQAMHRRGGSSKVESRGEVVFAPHREQEQSLIKTFSQSWNRPHSHGGRATLTFTTIFRWLEVLADDS